MSGIRTFFFRYIPLLVALATTLIAGCQFGSASMRIEVEVYKGPLSKEPLIQWYDLIGFLKEVEHGLDSIDGFIDLVTEMQAYPGMNDNEGGKNRSNKEPDVYKLSGDLTTWCSELSPYTKFLININFPINLTYNDCLTLKRLKEDLKFLHETVKNINAKIGTNSPINKQEASNILQDIAAIAGELRKIGFRKAVGGTAIQPSSLGVRIALVHFSAAVSEFGNQLHAKADALLKQIADEGHDRRELPLSVLISDTEATDFVHLYDLWDANYQSIYSFLKNFPLIPFAGNTLPIETRLKTLDRLFGDHNWSKVNTVYASGWGKVKMALIKDDIGNWNLKSFDSDPEELLQAYGDLAKSVLAKAAELAGDLTANAATGGGTTAIKQLLKVAQKTAFPATNKPKFPNVASELDELRTSTKTKLETATEKAKKEEEGLDSQGARDRRLKLVEEIREILRHHADLTM